MEEISLSTLIGSVKNETKEVCLFFIIIILKVISVILIPFLLNKEFQCFVIPFLCIFYDA